MTLEAGEPQMIAGETTGQVVALEESPNSYGQHAR